MTSITEVQKTNAKTVLTKKFEDAPYFKEHKDEMNAFFDAVVKSMEVHRKTAGAFRDQLLAIVSNASNLKRDIETFDPEELGMMNPSDILGRKLKAKQDKRSAKRSREVTDDTRILCNACGRVRKTRLNINRMAIDDEALGTQYEYNFEDYCQCGEDRIDLKSGAVQSDGEEDDDDDEIEKRKNHDDRNGPGERRLDVGPSSTSTDAQPPLSTA